MEDNSKRIKLISLAIAAISFVFAVISYFLLPDKIFVQIVGAGHSPETKTLIFLLMGVLIIGLAGAMCIFTDNGRKWIALESVIAIAFNGCIIYNFLVL